MGSCSFNQLLLKFKEVYIFADQHFHVARQCQKIIGSCEPWIVLVGDNLRIGSKRIGQSALIFIDLRSSSNCIVWSTTLVPTSTAANFIYKQPTAKRNPYGLEFPALGYLKK